MCNFTSWYFNICMRYTNIYKQHTLLLQEAFTHLYKCPYIIYILQLSFLIQHYLWYLQFDKVHSLFLMAEKYSIWWTYQVYSSISNLLKVSYVLSSFSTNNVAVNFIHASWCIHEKTSQLWIQKLIFWGSWMYLFNFVIYYHILLPSSYIHLYFHQKYMVVPILLPCTNIGHLYMICKHTLIFIILTNTNCLKFIISQFLAILCTSSPAYWPYRFSPL